MTDRTGDISRIKYVVERFLLGGSFDLCEDGRQVAVLEPAQCVAEISYGKLVLSCWGEDWSRSWRIVECEVGRCEAEGGEGKRQRVGDHNASPESLRLFCTRQMGRVSCAVVLQRGAGQMEVAASRADFAVRIRVLVESNLPGVKVERLITSRDDSRHLSGVHTRLILKDGNDTLAGIAVGERESQAVVDAALGTGLVWVEELRGRGAQIKRLLLFVPRGRAFNLACRLLFVRCQGVPISLYEIDEATKQIEPLAAFAQADLADGLKRAAARADWQVEQRGALSPIGEATGRTRALIEEIRSHAPGLVDLQWKGGWAYLSIRGLTFARISTGRARVEFGLELPRHKLTAQNRAELEDLIARVLAHRRPDACDRSEVAFRAQAEHWLESLLRRDITALDATLDPRYVYSQVPAYRGEQRSFIDLLAMTGGGRLVVVELKVSEDPEFPFQGLDYWLRVDWHRRRGDFERRGYFRGVRLLDAPPLIYLVAPLFRFHATTRLLASAIAGEAPIYRLGINEDWRSGVKVLLSERLN